MSTRNVISTSERRRARIEREVDRFALAQGLWPPDKRIVAGVSGGPDSSALLLILATLRQKRGFELVAAYFDHGLRGAEAARRERETAQELACRTGAAFVAGSGDVSALAKGAGLSIEEAARRGRYDFLARVAEERGIETVAVGHTADDQAETVLMHIIRGSGLTGIAGMHPLSRWPSAGHDRLHLVRPLLRLARADTEAYCRDAGVQPVEDESNASAAFMRNRVRSELIPALRDYNPRISEALNRLAEAARSDLSAIEEMALPALGPLEDRVTLNRGALRAMPEGLRRHAVRLALLRLLGDLQGFGDKHVEAVARAASGRASGQTLDLPRGVRAEVGRDLVRLRTGAPEPAADLSAEGVLLQAPGVARLGHVLVSAGPSALEDAEASVAVDADALGSEVRVRGWRPGDRMQPTGMAGTKKLQDLFVDAHLPRRERGRVPVFEAARGIVWAGGLRLAEWARPVEGRPVAVLSFRREG